MDILLVNYPTRSNHLAVNQVLPSAASTQTHFSNTQTAGGKTKALVLNKGLFKLNYFNFVSL
ncbi:MAG: hypothetical protein Q4E16_04620 [Neisseria sp.]|nr:hypothetical protein [Neisseria sp.]